MNNEDFRRSTRDNMNEDLLRSITEGISIVLASIYAANNVSAGNAANNVKREDKNMSGRSITLGTWNGNPIEWLVLKEEGLATLVISKDTIGKYYFDGNSSNNSWAHSWLRTFLNNDFYEKAFTAEEKKKIVNAKLTDVGNAKDNVFILSRSEVETLLTAENDDYTRRYANDCGYCCWTRTQDGSYVRNGYTNCSCRRSPRDHYQVRPAMWIKEQE